MIDLRSDTLTVPDETMLRTILSAGFGDDGRVDSSGRGEDPTVNALEDLAAELTGKEAAMLCCSGTMGNTTAIMTYCEPGDKVMVDTKQHIYVTEKVVFSERAGRMTTVFYHLDDRGWPDIREIEKGLQSGGVKLLCVENTHNSFGGAVVPPEHLKKVRELADRFRVPVHMDGARLFNAAVALGCPASELCQYVDSVMFCISKGLGAPIGSLVCASSGFIRSARNTRKLLGGNMRQAGIIAAPGIHALSHNISRLAEDHENARLLAGKLSDLRCVRVQQVVDSNIVMMNMAATGLTAAEYCEGLRQRGIRILPSSGAEHQVRLVFYKGVTREDTIRAADIIREYDQLFTAK